MLSSEAWNQIIERAKIQEFEIHTVPQNKRAPLWFRISTDGNIVIISQAKDNAPSSTLKMPRTISFDEFDRIYPYYQLRLNGSSVSQEAVRKSVNTVYIYGLIADALSSQVTL
ncbi:hypothetical protein FE783_13815 [Paenibacillus mesophilus]|uniref:hypothetical protein n=1 Tax=Paenibacillus mesophilus TaxID=2582849 RepID=UPI00110E7B06|nr:hypothetical protein [Paenibacillus mesophilus]TMV49572.1 hypothetical protein FE783_13815 [Paenibacillus mesophilus]